MFNNLNGSNNQNNGQPNSAVDDIFAETDKSPNPQSNLRSLNQATSAIDTHKVGLASAENVSKELSAASDNKWFKIVLIIIIVIILLLGGYLVYSSFFAPKTIDINSEQALETKAADIVVPSSSPASSDAPKTPAQSGFVATSSGNSQVVSNLPSAGGPVIPGVNAPAEIDNNYVSPTTSQSISPTNQVIDSDSDGLTDAEEKLAGTNINVIDTDGDGLSDYEEVKIYHTNPLKADTDGDGYLDGDEVKNGYNPNGSGKMPAASSTPKTK